MIALPNMFAKQTFLQLYNFKCFITAPCNNISRVSGGSQEVLQSRNEDEEAKQFFNSTFKGKYSIFMSKVCSLGAFAKLRKVTVSLSCPSVHHAICLSAWNNLAPPGQISVKFDI
jgi:hypothetical protein